MIRNRIENDEHAVQIVGIILHERCGTQLLAVEGDWFCPVCRHIVDVADSVPVIIYEAGKQKVGKQIEILEVMKY